MMRDPAGSGNVLANLVDEGGDGGMARTDPGPMSSSNSEHCQDLGASVFAIY
jgi:hypothetical protein